MTYEIFATRPRNALYSSFVRLERGSVVDAQRAVSRLRALGWDVAVWSRGQS